MDQTAYKTISAAKAAAAELVRGVSVNYKWSSAQYDKASAELENVGSLGDSIAASVARMMDPFGLHIGDMASLEQTQRYWEDVAELAEGWERDKLPGAAKIRATATQAAITSGSEIEADIAGSPVTIAAGGVKGTAEDYADVAEGGAGVLQAAGENPKTTIAIVAAVAVVGLGLYMSLILPRR